MALELASGKLLQGQQFSASKNYVEYYTQQMMSIQAANQMIGVPGVEITPHDELRSLVRVNTAPIAAIEAYNEVYDGTEDFRFHAVLTALNVNYSVNSGLGAGSHSAGTALASGPASFSFDPTSTSQSSASLIPSVQPVIIPTPSENLPVKHYYFYIKNGDNIYAKLTTLAGATVNVWPVFHPKPIYLTLTGVQANLRQSAEAQERCVFSGTNTWQYQFSDGSSGEISTGLNVNTMEISATLHGALTISNDTHSAIIFTAVGVSIPQITSTVTDPTTVLDAIAYVPPGISKTLTASVTPNTVAATSPASIPTSGLYLYKTTTAPFEWGYSIVKATVFDFATIA